MSNNLNLLRQKYPWPDKKPDLEFNPDGWLSDDNKIILCQKIKELNILHDPRTDPLLVLEIGSWVGLSSRFLCESTNFRSTIISIDHWKGSAEHKNISFISRLYDTFISNCWHHKNKIIPVKTDSITGLQEVYNCNIYPHLIYLDGSHDTLSVIKDLLMINNLFPNAKIIGDDWKWATVQAAVNQFSHETGRKFKTYESCFEVCE